MKIKLLLITVLSFQFVSAQKSNQTINKGAHADTVSVFLPGKITEKYSVRDMTISPAGDELFFTVIAPGSYFMSIVHCKRKGAGWTEPEMAFFSGQYSDLEPAYSPDGKRIFFVSNRPLKKGRALKDFDIWYVENKNGRWTEPQNAGNIINTEADEFYPAVTKSGNIYYTAAYPDAKGKEDIYVSEWKDGAWQKPYSLPDSINSKTYEFNAYISPDEDIIIFSSQGREDDLGGGDLYISVKDKNNNWRKAVHLPAPVNSPGLDYCPFISFDKKTFYFTSNRSIVQKQYNTPLTIKQLTNLLEQPLNGKGNIYRMDADKIIRLTY